MAVPLQLDEALLHTLAYFDAGDRRYEAAARRCIVRFAEEFEPAPLQLRKLADCFTCVGHHYFGADARAGIERLVEKIRRYRDGEAIRAEVTDFEFAGKVERVEWDPDKRGW